MWFIFNRLKIIKSSESYCSVYIIIIFCVDIFKISLELIWLKDNNNAVDMNMNKCVQTKQKNMNVGKTSIQFPLLATNAGPTTQSEKKKQHYILRSEKTTQQMINKAK